MLTGLAIGALGVLCLFLLLMVIALSTTIEALKGRVADLEEMMRQQIVANEAITRALDARTAQQQGVVEAIQRVRPSRVLAKGPWRPQ